MIVGILGGETVSSITVCKVLKKLECKVILFTDSKQSHGYFTKYADEKIIHVSIKKEMEFHKFLISKLSDLDVLIPITDPYAEYLSKYSDQLRGNVQFFLPSYSIFQKGYDKSAFMKFCQENNFSCPKTYFNFDDFSGLSNDEFPIIIKPNITFGARGMKIVNDQQELLTELPKIEKEFGKCHAQEFIPKGGKQYLVSIFTHNGSLINATVLEKIRFYPINGGSSTFCKTIDRSDLIEFCSKLQVKLMWDGFAHYDLIEDPRNSEIKVMELNPRIQGCIKASIVSGVDFISNILSCSNGQKPQKYTYISGKYIRYLGLDILWLIKSKEGIKSKVEWFSDFFKENHFLQDGSLDDLKPLLFGNFQSILRMLKPSFSHSKRGMNQPLR